MAAEPFTCTFETLDSTDALESLAGEWDDLVRGMRRPSPFLLHGWILEWWRHFGAGARLTLSVARRDGRLVGVAPMYTRRRGGLRVVRFLGGHESALADLLVADGEPETTARGLVAELRRQPFDYADLFGLPADSELVRAADGSLTTIERVEAPVLLMPDGWDAAYTAKTSSKKRNLHRRRLRQLSEIGEVEFVLGRTQAELEPLLEEALLLHELRWRGRPDGSTFGTETGRDFHRAALRRIADDDVLRIVMMRVGGKPAAFHYFFAFENTMFVHRLAFDPALSRASPGLVATLETLRVASDEGLTRVEYLGGDERYKLELSDHLEPLYQAVGLARTTLGSLAARERLALINLRKTLKRSERLQRLYLNGLNPLRSIRKRGRTADSPVTDNESD
jgi:CelD/BcsL family acetyltransferase involved in cellulose biosynthesis